jgi:hypothetical protein
MPQVPPAPKCVLDVEYLSRRAALSSSKALGGSLSLFVPCDRSLSRGDQVSLRVSFRDMSQGFGLRGTVQSSTAESILGVGFTVSFRGEEKRQAARMLAVCADRSPEMGTQLTPRVPMKLSCDVRGPQGRAAGVLVDLSRSGAFVALPKPLALEMGAVVELRIEPNLLGLGGTRLGAKLVWQGAKAGLVGVGVRFVGATDGLGRYLSS